MKAKEGDTMDEQLRQPYEGQLIKFTNVVKGWQARWFILNPETGSLDYYLSESDKHHERARGGIQLAGAVISPSDEDSYTFTVSPASGESYKLRATDTRDRQMWINRLRVVAEMHTRAIAHNHPPLAPREHRSSHYGSTVPATPPAMGLAVLDAFTQVAEVLQEARRHHEGLASAIDDLPSYGVSMKCTEPNILLLKATSQAAVLCLDQCLGVLRTQHMSSPSLHTSPPVINPSGRFGSPQVNQASPYVRQRTAPHSPSQSHISQGSSQTMSTSSAPTRHEAHNTNASAPNAAVATSSAPSLTLTSQDSISSLTGESSSSAATVVDGAAAADPSVSSSQVSNTHSQESPERTQLHMDAGAESEISDEEDGVGGEGGNFQLQEDGQRSIIMHIISQLRLGMDLTRVTLPTFILEKKSLLEMFADFLGHPDLFVRIGNCNSPEERIQAVVKWYLTSIHVGRNGCVAKKPYNPIIGETFHCSWKVPRHTVETPKTQDTSEIEGKKLPSYITVKFSAEQVSHHPPVSAFWIECPEKQLCVNAHIWTKSKFLGMSVGVNLVGDIKLVVGDEDVYSLAMPSAYARSILTEPWVELGGRINVHAHKSDCNANIVFHTKPFYGGKLHSVSAEVKNDEGGNLLKVQGEWDSQLEFTYSNGQSEVLDVKEFPLVCLKRVRPLSQQAPTESRRQWHDVSVALARGDVDTATSHKRALEEVQRAQERERAARNAKFQTRVFSSPSPDHWVYNTPPLYAANAFQTTPVTTPQAS
ncbi:unnamed protein product, partial [Meganyctiphanes norvegica]